MTDAQHIHDLGCDACEKERIRRARLEAAHESCDTRLEKLRELVTIIKQHHNSDAYQFAIRLEETLQ